jgi:hypothetical protein
MKVHGEGGVLVSLLGCMGWVLLKNIRRSWGKFCNHTRFEVRDGSKVRFWHDFGFWDMALKDVFPVLFGIACANDASVAVHVKFSGGAIQWNISFARVVHDW